jgi:Tol biopolymer transport system component
MNGIDVDVLLEGLLALVGDVEAIGEDGILAGAAFSGKNGRIAFSAFTPKRGPSPDEIFTTNPDGTGERQRTPTTPRAFNSSPSYSPDGTKIAWERVVVGPNGPNLSRDDGDIWVIDADGTNKKRLTGSPADDFGPAFSPDGRKVTFTRGYEATRAIATPTYTSRSLRAGARGGLPTAATTTNTSPSSAPTVAG